MYGGLIASGWHTCAMVMRMMCDTYMLQSASVGFARHRQPQMAETRASRRHHQRAAHDIGTRASKSKPDIASSAICGKFSIRTEKW